MNERTDQELLREYAHQREETAFAELVRRHAGLVYSAALRMVRDAHLAEDVTQGVFVALAQSAGQLTDRVVLSGWLHRTAQNLAANAVRSDVRRRIREQKVAAMNELFSAEPDVVWEEIAPHLDTALGELSEADRDALMLRFFEHKSAREIAQILGTSDEAAQKRVNRATERLRGLLEKRGLTVGAAGLAVALSANSVHAAPTALIAAISATAPLAATAVAAAGTATVTKAVVMTTLQKTVLVAGFGAFVGFGIYEARQNAILRTRIKSIEQKPSPQRESSQDTKLASLNARIDLMLSEKNDLARALSQANADKARLETEREQARHSAALFKELANQTSSSENNSTNQYPTPRHALRELGRLARLFGELNKDNSDNKLSEDEKSANEVARLNLVGNFFNLIKVLKQFEMDKSSPDSKALDDDPADSGACVLYGALDLNQEQFGAIYGILDKYHQEAKQKKLLGDNAVPDAGAALKEMNEQVKAEISNVLTEEQSAIFQELAAHVKFSGNGANLDLNFTSK